MASTVQERTTDDEGAPDSQSGKLHIQQRVVNDEQDAEDACTWRRMFKLVLALVMMVVMLACMVLSTLFTFALAKDLKNEVISTSVGNGTTLDHSADADFVALWLILFLPPAFGLVLAMKDKSVSSGQPWPNMKSLVWFSFIFSLLAAPVMTLVFAVNLDMCPWFENALWCKEGKQAVVEGLDYLRVSAVVFGQFICSVYNYIETAPEIHEKVSNMFWYPNHTGVLTGQHMLLNRTKVPEHPAQPPPEATDLRGRVMICTTMYHDSSVKYILATDGDVDFDADSIVAMLLQMLSDREEDVGAVCARTHPVGSGPLVWYQMFDYAIGHWLQKVANHVLGSVLCSPGCFSVYRVEAIADVLEEYRSDVEEASDFLTKDMGEDRWFTTLLVKAGWKINYCAGAVDSTHCPEEFGEFWKQRRRWIPSTLANQILLLKNWKDVKKNNKYISMGFLLYQVILLLSTVISPSTCILTITGSTFLCG
uniref:chitin synthase n=1 Tax=Branchiostoma floridae TaxID=7739 RepID=C3ZFI3_BRAFL|eukprot:XP_002592726.1 hypothetical protein BRAFLDRAFT_67166 [Branchiostoma floridae]